MSFMESPFVTRAIEEIEYLQDHIKEVSLIFVADQESPYVDELKVEFLHSMYALAEKEHNLWTRISLSDDPDAVEYRQQLMQQLLEADTSGSPMPLDVNHYFINLKDGIKEKIRELTGEDMDNYDGIDIIFNWTDGSGAWYN